MMELQGIGKLLLIAAALLALLGVAFMFFDKIPFLGKLPGDINIKREGYQIYIPITTSILLSLALSLILWIISHFRK